MARKPSK